MHPWGRPCIAGGRGQCPRQKRREREVRGLPSSFRIKQIMLRSGILWRRRHVYIPIQHEYDAISQTDLEIIMLLKLKNRLQRCLSLLEDQNSGSRSTSLTRSNCRTGKVYRIRVPPILRVPHPLIFLSSIKYTYSYGNCTCHKSHGRSNDRAHFPSVVIGRHVIQSGDADCIVSNEINSVLLV